MRLQMEATISMSEVSDSVCVMDDRGFVKPRPDNLHYVYQSQVFETHGNEKQHDSIFMSKSPFRSDIKTSIDINKQETPKGI